MKTTLFYLTIVTSSLLPCMAAEMKTIAAEEKAEKLPKKIGRVSFEGGNGETIETAIVIKGAKDTEEGVAAEGKWVKKVHRKWVKEAQALFSKDGKHYDKINYKTEDGDAKTLYFDITDFFGKH